MRELCGLETLNLQLVWHDDIRDWLEYTTNQWQNSEIDDRLLIDMAGNAICGSVLAGCFLAISTDLNISELLNVQNVIALDGEEIVTDDEELMVIDELDASDCDKDGLDEDKSSDNSMKTESSAGYGP